MGRTACENFTSDTAAGTVFTVKGPVTVAQAMLASSLPGEHPGYINPLKKVPSALSREDMAFRVKAKVMGQS